MTRRPLESLVFRPRPRASARAVLLELESVLVPQRWLRDVLIPATRVALPAFVARNRDAPEVRDALMSIQLSIPRPTISDAALLVALDRWTAEDRTHPALRALHALVWEELLEQRALVVPVYPDAASALLRWNAEGREVYTYSSRPESAQALLLSHSAHGPLDRSLRRAFFAGVVERREPELFRALARQINVEIDAIVVLAESRRDLTAAAVAGAPVMQVLRDDKVSDGEYFWTRSLDVIEFGVEHSAAS